MIDHRLVKRLVVGRLLAGLLIVLGVAATLAFTSGGLARVVHAAPARPATDGCSAVAYGWDNGGHVAAYESNLNCHVDSPNVIQLAEQREELQECQGWDGNQVCDAWVYVGASLKTCYGAPPYNSNVNFWCPSISAWTFGGLGGQELRVQSHDTAQDSSLIWSVDFFEYSSSFTVA